MRWGPGQFVEVIDYDLTRGRILASFQDLSLFGCGRLGRTWANVWAVALAAVSVGTSCSRVDHAKALLLAGRWCPMLGAKARG